MSCSSAGLAWRVGLSCGVQASHLTALSVEAGVWALNRRGSPSAASGLWALSSWTGNRTQVPCTVLGDFLTTRPLGKSREMVTEHSLGSED